MFHISSMTLSLHDLLNMTSSGVGGRGRQPLNMLISPIITNQSRSYFFLWHVSPGTASAESSKSRCSRSGRDISGGKTKASGMLRCCASQRILREDHGNIPWGYTIFMEVSLVMGVPLFIIHFCLGCSLISPIQLLGYPHIM